MNDAHHPKRCGTLVRRILLPAYVVRDAYPAFERAVVVGRKFDAALLIAAIVDQGAGLVLCSAPVGPGAAIAAVDKKSLAAFRTELGRRVSELADRAADLGVQSEATTTVGSAPDEVVQLSRCCDLIIETEFHRRPFWETRLLGRADIYKDAACPILVARGEPFANGRILLIYSRSQRANRALRWVARLADGGGWTPDLHALVVFRNKKERQRLLREVVSVAAAHGLTVGVDTVSARVAFYKAVELGRALGVNLVAMPAHGFPRPLRLRLHGIDREALEDLRASVLLFT